MNSNQKATVLVGIVTAFITTFTASALNLSIPAISKEFIVSATQIGWIINGYILASAALSVPFGRLADLTGRKRILMMGIFIFTVCSLGICLIKTIEAFILLRVIQGIGAAMIFSTSQAVLVSVFPPEQKGKMLGLSVASTYTGLSAGPVVGGALNHSLGWCSIFILTFIISLIAFFICWRKLPKLFSVKDNWRKRMDIAGSLLYITMIISVMYGFSAYSTTAYGKYLIPVGIVLFILFIYYELKVESPVIQIRLFRRNVNYLFSNLAALLNYAATFALGYLLSIYLQMVKGFDSQQAGLILISQPLIMALLSPHTGKLSDRISPYKLASLGMAFCALGLFGFTFLNQDYPMALIIINLVVVGVGFAFFSSPNTNAVMSCVETKDYSVASSILATMRNLGQSSGMAALTLILSLYIGDIPLAEVDTNSLVSTMRTSYIFFACLCLVGIFISLQNRRKG